MNDRIYTDCCDFCVLIDDSKNEVEPCTDMTKRCKGDPCATCPPCKRFAAGLGFTDALKLARTRPKRKDAQTARKLRSGAF